MPYRVRWRDDAVADLMDLPGLQYQAVRKMVGSFAHDRWLKGRPFRNPQLADAALLLLRAGDKSIIYRIDEEQRLIEIFAIV